MYCPKCGMEVPDNSEYCPTCGYKVIEDYAEDNKVSEEDPFEKVEENKDYVSAGNDKVANKVFAFIGFGTGIYSLIFCWVPFMFFSAIIGMVFGKLGSRDNTKKQYGKSGFVMSLIALIIGIIATIGFFAIMIAFADEAQNNGWYWD